MQMISSKLTLKHQRQNVRQKQKSSHHILSLFQAEAKLSPYLDLRVFFCVKQQKHISILQ